MRRSILFLGALAAAVMSSAMSVIANMSGVGPFMSVGLGVLTVLVSIIVSETMEYLRARKDGDDNGKAV